MTRKFAKIAETIVKEDKNSDLYESLNRFFQNDVLVTAEYPIEKFAKYWKKHGQPEKWYKEISLTGLAPTLREQIKTFMRNELLRGNDWTWHLVRIIPYLEKIQKEDILLCTDKELYADYISYYFGHHHMKSPTREHINLLRKIKSFTKCLQLMQNEAWFKAQELLKL